MDIEHFISGFASFGGSLLVVLGAVYTISTRLAKIELKVDTMWDFLIRRAKGEAVMAGVATMNSPMKMDPDAVEKLVPKTLKEKLIAAAPQLQKLPEREMAIELERRFGEEILSDICLKHNLHMGACLLLCIAVVRGDGLLV